MVKRYKYLGVRTVTTKGGSLVIPIPEEGLSLLEAEKGTEVGIIIDREYNNVIIKRRKDIKISGTGLSDDASLEFNMPSELMEKS